MHTNDWLQLALFLGLLALITKPMGLYLMQVLNAQGHTWLDPILKPIEKLTYRLLGTDPQREQNWKQYTLSMLAFSLVGMVFTYLILRCQHLLPWNPQDLPALSPHLAFNTAVSFTTNTNWQSYGGESTMSYLSQMAGLAVQNFLSAATGIALAMAFVRGFARAETKALGNFWADMVRATLYVLLPFCLLLTVFYVWQGVPQNLASYVEATTVEGAKQTIAQGPVASQLAIKMLGTNGGGFFNANSAHPYENPTALTNFVQMLAIFLIPAALCFAFGRVVGDQRQGFAILAAMTVMFVVAVIAVVSAEKVGNPQWVGLGVEQTASALQAGGNMEGKEVRFGINASALFAAVTTAASCGAVNSMHDSFTPLGGMVPLVLMQLGEVVFGGVGTGLYGMLVFAILAVFMAGLMIGRTPEYLGKKIEPYEMKLTSAAILVTPILVLVGTAIAVATDAGRAGIANPGAHGFSEILYALTSAANNNGSAFA
ncbi:MAG TPA: potassium-transporting ATPase subunit KdpA, partial [Verrucomicrobiales bacterium]|nr:potassium-transporting ATPase subunit KdpA [Verrucomicrobiales bacterium]